MVILHLPAPPSPDQVSAQSVGCWPMPVHTGVAAVPDGDPSLLEAAAQLSFDSSPLLISDIQQLMAQRAAELEFNFEQLCAGAARLIQVAKTRADTLDLSVCMQARGHLAQGSQSTQELMAAINLHVARTRDGQRSAEQPI